ncbi:hypothetical protein [Maricaulis sp.]|uniref:hypothetical protein n=1 Tax=Maricaulis sp. TaxID=1486257 RepID=UPI002B2756E1|nr:hypothetical protein [Maricaulis sp.]
MEEIEIVQNRAEKFLSEGRLFEMLIGAPGYEIVEPTFGGVNYTMIFTALYKWQNKFCFRRNFAWQTIKRAFNYMRAEGGRNAAVNLAYACFQYRKKLRYSCARIRILVWGLEDYKSNDDDSRVSIIMSGKGYAV